MGLLDDAIREHLELKRRRGANPDEVARQEEAALGPPRRGDFAQPGAEPAAGPAEDFERPPEEAVRIRPVEDDREPFADDVPEFDPLGAEEAGPAADQVAEHEPGPAADDVAAYAPEPVAGDAPAYEPRAAADDVAPYLPEPAAEAAPAYEPRAVADDVAPNEPGPAADDVVPSDRPQADLGDLPAEPAPRRRTPAADWLDDEPDEVPTEEALERPRPAAEPGDEDAPPAGDEDVLEETPEFLQETPEHDRLWFEQRPPRDFDFDK
jgi:hypothetical protein